jgi:hypothetical protein
VIVSILGLVHPQPIPDRPRLTGRRETAEAVPDLGDRDIEAFADVLARGEIRTAGDDVVALGLEPEHNSLVAGALTRTEAAAVVPIRGKHNSCGRAVRVGSSVPGKALRSGPVGTIRFTGVGPVSPCPTPAP